MAFQAPDPSRSGTPVRNRPARGNMSPAALLWHQYLYAKYMPNTHRHAGKGLCDLNLNLGKANPEADKNGFILGQKLQVCKVQATQYQDTTPRPACVGNDKMDVLQRSRDKLRMNLKNAGWELKICDPPCAEKRARESQGKMKDGPVRAGINTAMAKKMEEELRAIELRRQADRERRRRERRESKDLGCRESER